MSKQIVFYQDMYTDNNILVWKGNKIYNILEEVKGLYKCECEIREIDNSPSDSNITNEYAFIEKSTNSIINIFYTI